MTRRLLLRIGVALPEQWGGLMKSRNPFTRRTGARVLSCAAAVVLALGCRWPWSSSPEPEAGSALPSSLPEVDAPVVTPQPAPAVQDDLLPAGSKLAASSQSLQTIQMTLTARAAGAQTSREVFNGVIEPMLRAVGFTGGASAFALPPAGIVQPRPNLAGAARLMRQRPGASPQLARNQALLDALVGQKEPTESDGAALQRVEGASIAGFAQRFERVELIYPFVQVVEGVPIEHTALVASRWDEQTVNSVSGTLLHRHTTLNRRPSPDADPIGIGQRALLKVDGLQGSKPVHRGDPPVLVLLPYGNAPDGSTALRHAWRMTFEVPLSGLPASFLVWVDADAGNVLKLQPLTSAVSAAGNTWRRDPGTGAVLKSTFELDAASAGGPYELKLDKVFQRLDFKGDEIVANDLSLPGPVGASLDFDHPPLNDGASAVCSSGGNSAYQQIHLFAALQMNRLYAIYNGIYEPFPAAPWKPIIEGTACGAWSTMYFGACKGYTETACPAYAAAAPPGQPDPSYINFAHDSSIIAHEVAHVTVQRMVETRPFDWCGSSDCPIPVGWSQLHDLADAVAAHIEDTDCIGGWVAKNVGGPNVSLNCVGDLSAGVPDPESPAPARHYEDDKLPRRLELDLAFRTDLPRDHFPERRADDINVSRYPDMQIASAILWQVREGMNSRYPVTGSLVYFEHFLQAIKGTGLTATEPPPTDSTIYGYLEELERKMLTRWSADVPGGDASSSDVVAGFARGGVFVLPSSCIDGDPATGDDWFCPTASGGEDGADAAIDVDDNDATDDTLADGVRHVESDFVRSGGPPPTFHVWTGPRFVFKLGSARPVRGTSPCNTHFRVELSLEPSFSGDGLSESGLWPVDIDANTVDGAECHGTWTPSSELWNQLVGGSEAPRSVYYRARTSDAAGNRERLTTQPGKGFWIVPPPSVRVTSDGLADL